VGRLPENSIVLFTALSADASGRHFITGKESAPMVASASDVPVFGMGDVLVGTGIVGGYVINYSAQGQIAAQMIRRILAGERPESIPIVDDTSVYMFDWRALRKWKIRESKLPNGSIVLFRTPTIWERYPRQTLGVGIAFLALLTLSAYLLFERRRRRLAELSLQSNLAFEKLISELSTCFIDLTSETIDIGIQQALDRLRLFFKVDRISVLEFTVDCAELLRTYTSSETGNAPTIYRFDREKYNWFTATLLNREKLVISDIEHMAELPESERSYFMAHGIGSLASVPLEAGHTILGSLTLIMVGKEAVWPDHLVDQLTVVGQVFANALVRKHTDDALVSSEMLKGAILSALSNSVTILNEMGEIILTTSRRREIADPIVEDANLVAGTNYLEACRQAGERGDAAAKQALAGMENVLQGKQQRFEMEWSYLRFSTPQWSLMTVTPLNNQLSGLVISYIDITARKHADEERLELSGRLIRAQEDERSRLARELHDDFNQRLAVLAIDLERTAAIISDSPLQATRRLHELWKSVSEIGADLHSLSHRLHSSTLECLGLVLSVSSYCRDFTEQQDVQVDFTHKDVPRDIPAEAALCIFRIVQEGLRNIKKHSGATRAEVRLEGVSDALHILLADEGVGFDTTNRSTRTGLGIRSMEERLRVLGGRIDIRSHPAQGTTIEVWVPLNPAIAGDGMTRSTIA
jgi:signal transduction histidine kinase